MQSVPIFEVKNKLPSFIHQVESGAVLQLTRHNKPVAVLLGKKDFDSLQKKHDFDTILFNFREQFSDYYDQSCSDTDDTADDLFENVRQKDVERKSPDKIIELFSESAW